MPRIWHADASEDFQLFFLHIFQFKKNWLPFMREKNLLSL